MVESQKNEYWQPLIDALQKKGQEWIAVNSLGRGQIVYQETFYNFIVKRENSWSNARTQKLHLRTQTRNESHWEDDAYTQKGEHLKDMRTIYSYPDTENNIPKLAANIASTVRKAKKEGLASQKEFTSTEYKELYQRNLRKQLVFSEVLKTVPRDIIQINNTENLSLCFLEGITLRFLQGKICIELLHKNNSEATFLSSTGDLRTDISKVEAKGYEVYFQEVRLYEQSEDRDKIMVSRLFFLLKEQQQIPGKEFSKIWDFIKGLSIGKDIHTKFLVKSLKK